MGAEDLADLYPRRPLIGVTLFMKPGWRTTPAGQGVSNPSNLAKMKTASRCGDHRLMLPRLLPRRPGN